MSGTTELSDAELVVAAHMGMTPDVETFSVFSDSHPMLFDKNALLAFYSDEVLNIQRARAEWVEPDLRPLP